MSEHRNGAKPQGGASGLRSGQSRKAPRRRTRLHIGRVFDGSLRFLSEVTIHDLSEQGARIRMQRMAALPERFILADETEGRIGLAQLRWRKQQEAGLAILEWRARTDLDSPSASRLFGACYAADE